MKRLLTGLLIAGVLAVGSPPSASAAPGDPTGPVLYVAPDGDDANDGTIDRPLRTLEGARDALRESGAAPGGATVYLREGEYPRTASFELGPTDSGTAEAPVVYRSYPGETARLTGGTDLDRAGFTAVTDAAVLDRIVDQSARSKVLQFDLAAHGLTDYGVQSRHGYWKANDVSAVPPMQLFVDGEGMTLARWPNAGTVQMDEILDVGPTRKDADLQERGGTFSYTYDRPRYWTQADDVWLDGIFGYSWEWSYNKIASIDPEAKTITLAYGEMSGLMKTWFEDFHFAENLLEELDAAGEYYIDRAAGVLYFMPNASFLAGSDDLTVTMLSEPMIRTDGTSHVTFQDLVLEYGRATAAVILGGEGITIADSDIQNFTDGGVLINSPGRYTYNGIPVNRGGRNHAVTGSHLRHIGGVAVVLQGGDRTTLQPGNNRVENSHIHDFAYYHKAYNPGVMFDGVGNAARGNEIHDAPHPGIIVHGNDHLIERNEIYDVCTTFQDLGAIYMNAGMTPQQRGTVIRQNYFHDTGMGRLGVEGIYPDNLTMGLTIEENVFYRMGNAAIKSGSGDHIVARNNVFVDSKVPYDNYELWMGNQPGNVVDASYMPAWEKLFAENNGFVGTPYAEKYPELVTFFDENHYYPANNFFERNLTWNPTLTRSSQVNAEGARDVKALLNYTDNWVAGADPGFVDWQAGDFRLKPDAEVFSRIPGFQAVPFDQIGTQGKVGHPLTPDTVTLDGVYLPTDALTVRLGAEVPFAAALVPWNTTEPGVEYASSDPSVVTVDAAGVLRAQAPGQAVITASSTSHAGLTDTATVTVASGDGVMHATDFESGANGWPVDPNRSIVEDADGDHWYRIKGGANSQLPRDFGSYVLEYQVRTPSVVPEGGVLLMYDRTGPTPGGFVRYRDSATGSKWTIFGPQWQVLKEVVLPPGAGMQPDSTYDIRVAVTDATIRVSVDGVQVLEGPKPGQGNAGRVGFYVEKFTHLDFDDITFSLAAVPVTGIDVDAASLALEPGESRQLTVSVTPADATSTAVDWGSSAPDVATVDESGRVRAVGAGTATITAASRTNPEVAASVEVQVTAVDHPVIELNHQFADAAHWSASDAVTVDAGAVSFSAEGVYGYDGEKFGSGLLGFRASFGDFDGGWYGFAVRSDRAGDPTWVGGNKGCLVVIKEDQIEFQSWKPGQVMLDVIPNTAVLAGHEHQIEYGAVGTDQGTRLVFRVDGRTVWSGLDDPESPIAETGYLNVYHYGESNTLTLSPTGEPATITGVLPTAESVITTEYAVGDALDVTGMELAVQWSDGGTTTVPVTPEMVSGFDSGRVDPSQTLTISYGGATTTVTVSVRVEPGVPATTRVLRLTFDADGGTAVAPRIVRAGGTLASLPRTVRDGYEFEGWYDADGDRLTTATVVDSPTGFTARWSPVA